MVSDVHLQNYRSYKDESFDLGNKVNIIVGPNGSGKTNLLEAILVLSTGKSYRTKTDGELITHGSRWTKIEAHLENNDTRIVKLKSEAERTVKTFQINDNNLQRLNLNNLTPVILFEPNHLFMFSGSPDLRRQYIDDLLGQTVAGYKELHRRYRRALAQRNNLLKRGPEQGMEQLFAWNLRLSEYGEKIALARHKLIEELGQSLSTIYSRLSKKKTALKAVYKSPMQITNYGSSLLKKLESQTETDIARGFTSYGPHREDLEIFINGHLVQTNASRGELRTLLLTLKIAEATVIEETRQERPLLLFDDVFSELDVGRRQALTEFLSSYQTFITTTDADVVIQHFTEKANIIPLTKK